MSKKHSDDACIQLVSPPFSELWSSVLQGGPELQVALGLLCFLVPDCPFFHLGFVFQNIQWQKLPQKKKWEKSCVERILLAYTLPMPRCTGGSPQLSCSGKFLLQSLLPLVGIAAEPFSITLFQMPGPQIKIYLVSVWMLVHTALHESLLLSCFEISLRRGQEECSS